MCDRCSRLTCMGKKDKKGKTFLNAFMEIVNEANRKPSGLIKEENFTINLCNNG